MEDVIAILNENSNRDLVYLEDEIYNFFDSLGWTSALWAIEQKFGIKIPDKEWEDLYSGTLKDTLKYIERKRNVRN